MLLLTQLVVIVKYLFGQGNRAFAADLFDFLEGFHHGSSGLAVSSVLALALQRSFPFARFEGRLLLLSAGVVDAGFGGAELSEFLLF